MSFLNIIGSLIKSVGKEMIRPSDTTKGMWARKLGSDAKNMERRTRVGTGQNSNVFNQETTKPIKLVTPAEKPIMYEINTNYKYINELYDKLSYYDMYGTTIMIFLLLTIFVLFVYGYFQIMRVREDIANDWQNQRCNPKYIPFAGYITHPDGTTPFQYTSDNFQYCIQNVENDVAGQAMSPLNYLISGVTNMLNIIGTSVQHTRDFLNTLRKNIRKFAEDVFHKILNVMIPLMSLIISLKDMLDKTQGIMTAGLYTFLGAYDTLKSLMGSIVELTVVMLLVMVIIIMGLWALPFSWPAAASFSAIYVIFALLLSILVIFLTQVMGIKSSSVPKLRCFDKDTPLEMVDGTYKKIIDVNAGDMLANRTMVTAKMKVSSEDLRMFTLNNVTVSESHIVLHQGQWIPVRDHPLAQELFGYSEPFLYCLNTSSKEIIINNITFTDWDEIYEKTLTTVINAVPQNIFIKDELFKKANIHRHLDVGFESNTIIYLADGSNKHIKDIRINDKLSTRGIVYGIVEIEKDTILGNLNAEEKEETGETCLYHLLVSNKIFETKGKIISDYNDKIDSILKIKKII